MSIFIPRGQPPTGDGSFNGGPADPNNTDTSDSAPGSLSSDPAAWWWSSDAEALRWGIVAAIFVAFILCLSAAYTHAKRRISKGLQPLPYHRWLVRRHQRPLYASQHQNDLYNMQPFAPYAAPPPAYNAEHDYVPAYTPPAEGSKIKMKDETAVATEGGPSQPPAVANPSRPTYS